MSPMLTEMLTRNRENGVYSSVKPLWVDVNCFCGLCASCLVLGRQIES